MGRNNPNSPNTWWRLTAKVAFTQKGSNDSKDHMLNGSQQSPVAVKNTKKQERCGPTEESWGEQK